MQKLLLIQLLIITTVIASAQDTVYLSNVPADSLFEINQHGAYFADSTNKLNVLAISRQTFQPRPDLVAFSKNDRPGKSTVWVRWHLVNNTDKDRQLEYIFHRVLFLSFYVADGNGIHLVKELPPLFTSLPKMEQKSFPIEIAPGSSLTVYARLKDLHTHMIRPEYPVLANKNVWPQLVKENLYTDRYYVFLDVLFLSIIFFIVIHSLAQYFFNRRKEFLLYACYGISVLAYFLFKFDEKDYADISFSHAPYLLKYCNNFLSYINYYTYYRFVRCFIDFKAIAPWFYKVIRVTEMILLLAILVDAFANLQGLWPLRYLIFDLVRYYGLVVGFTGVVILFRSENKLAYFIATGSGLLMLSGLLTMLYSKFYSGPDGGFDEIIIYQSGIVLELLCFTLGLSYKTSRIEKEKLQTQMLLVNQLEENKKLQGELTYRLETRVQEQTAEILRKQDELEKEREQQLMLEFKKKLAEMELQVLKSQLNPHFYFNTLNNLYGLTLMNPSKAPDAILKLSDIMEYVIYDCKQEKVPLEKELKFISSYFELEKLRYDDNAQIELKVKGNSQYKFISPLLLIQFIENAFKHGMEDNKQDSFLKVDISVDGQQLIYRSINSLNGKQHNENGIGLANVRKRLNILYPERYQLKIDEEREFLVELKLNL